MVIKSLLGAFRFNKPRRCFKAGRLLWMLSARLMQAKNVILKKKVLIRGTWQYLNKVRWKILYNDDCMLKKWSSVPTKSYTLPYKNTISKHITKMVQSKSRSRDINTCSFKSHLWVKRRRLGGSGVTFCWMVECFCSMSLFSLAASTTSWSNCRRQDNLVRLTQPATQINLSKKSFILMYKRQNNRSTNKNLEKRRSESELWQPNTALVNYKVRFSFWPKMCCKGKLSTIYRTTLNKASFLFYIKWAV